MTDERSPITTEVQAAKKIELRAEAVYLALRQSIVTLGDEPGSILTEKAVAQRFGVARPTAKAALERLVEKGLLRRSAHRAAVVPVLSSADIEDLYAARTMIEVAAVERLASKGQVPARALAAQSELRERVQEGYFVGPDLGFHQALVAGLASPRLTRMHDLILGEVELCMGQLEAHKLIGTVDIIKQHQGILEAIEGRDAELAGFLTRRHIVNARDRLLSSFQE